MNNTGDSAYLPTCPEPEVEKCHNWTLTFGIASGEIKLLNRKAVAAAGTRPAAAPRPTLHDQ